MDSPDCGYRWSEADAVRRTIPVVIHGILRLSAFVTLTALQKLSQADFSFRSAESCSASRSGRGVEEK
jgi:hypothetical protein